MIICIFCHKQTIYHHGYEWCQSCSIHYAYQADAGYHANMSMQGDDLEGRHWNPYIQFSLPPRLPNAKLIIGPNVIVYFKGMPDINPQNIRDKIKLYLTFS